MGIDRMTAAVQGFCHRHAVVVVRRTPESKRERSSHLQRKTIQTSSGYTYTINGKTWGDGRRAAVAHRSARTPAAAQRRLLRFGCRHRPAKQRRLEFSAGKERAHEMAGSPYAPASCGMRHPALEKARCWGS